MAEPRTRRLLAVTIAAVVLAACDGSPNGSTNGATDGSQNGTATPSATEGSSTTGPANVARITTSTGTVEVAVEIADTDEERAVGLMHRTSLPADRGMAFLWEEPTEGGFWMKDTLIPLSIAFWDEGGRILAILDMQPCEADPCPVYDPGVAYIGAIEVNLGFFEERGVERGDRIELERAG